MSQSYAQWSAATLQASEREPRKTLARAWLAHLKTLDPAAPADEAQAQKAAELFTGYLASCRADDVSLSTLPPGRFLMPGDLAGSPLLTFAPLPVEPAARAKDGSLHAMMERRYDAYVSRVVEPFFYNHFARLDRQIVLVDTLSALNAGTEAVRISKRARPTCWAVSGRAQIHGPPPCLAGAQTASCLPPPRRTCCTIPAMTSWKTCCGLIVEDARKRAEFAGARIDVAAIAAIRATREATVKQDGETLECIAGIPIKGEELAGETFNGTSEAAIFPGDLPDDPAAALDGSLEGELRFVRFRPPLVQHEGAASAVATFPHIRLDRALEFLIGDRLT